MTDKNSHEWKTECYYHQMRRMEWEKTKGIIRSSLCSYVDSKDKDRKQEVKDLIDRFIFEVESNEYQLG